MKKEEIELTFSETEDQLVQFLNEFLRFPTIGVQPEHAEDCRACAEWLCKRLQEIGLTTSLLETSGHPVACGTFKGEPDRPHVIFYGHYDVQPADPLEEWHSDPFEPIQRGDRIYARGAHDDKGQVTAFIHAVGAMIAAEKLKCSLTILLEGEEESGSGGLQTSLPEWKEWLQADVLMAMDTSLASEEVPAVVVGLRGLIAFEVNLGGLKRDLHSGVHGGIVKNPATELAKLLARLFNADGSIAVPGFYADVEEPTQELLDMIAKSPFDAEEYQKETGLPPLGGELRFPPKVRNGVRPSLDIVGISAGYQGEGIKTIIPAAAKAKLSARLVPQQDPAAVFSCIEKYLKDHTPEGFTLSVKQFEHGSKAVQCLQDAKVVQDAWEILEEIFGREPVAEWEGASIPIITDLVQTTGAVPLLVGFGLEEDNIHAPNESFSLRQLRWGFEYSVRILSRFSEPTV
ncbi:MAG: M20/M25/M40 family metallo-hydrolase [Bdellovibrionota bacterium]|jgi:acetylornithine deacetylase/succinyl-diaminopimelate desuccinylase-like protein